MCNNNGHCRKFDAGTMCPSYRATRDEQHLTRGRANTLRLALSGQLGPDAFTSDAMQETLDLCVSCKGCRRECPTGVDMARMKIEFLHHYMGATACRCEDRLDRLPAALRAVVHHERRARSICATRMPGAAALLEAALRPVRQPPLPTWRSDTFWREASRPAARDGDAARRPRLVLFVDTFNRYFEPENASRPPSACSRPPATACTRAAEGRRPLCCGRTFLAAGLVDEARQEARRTARRAVAVRRGRLPRSSAWSRPAC